MQWRGLHPLISTVYADGGVGASVFVFVLVADEDFGRPCDEEEGVVQVCVVAVIAFPVRPSYYYLPLFRV